jgi:hypothetical protein
MLGFARVLAGEVAGPFPLEGLELEGTEEAKADEEEDDETETGEGEDFEEVFLTT